MSRIGRTSETRLARRMRDGGSRARCLPSQLYVNRDAFPGWPLRGAVSRRRAWFFFFRSARCSSGCCACSDLRSNLDEVYMGLRVAGLKDCGRARVSPF